MRRTRRPGARSSTVSFAAGSAGKYWRSVDLRRSISPVRSRIAV